jgi:hypothetical protein
MIWYILMLLFVLLLLWILMGPVILSVNTERKRYQLMLPGVVQARVVYTEEVLILKGWIFFIPFRINPFRIKGKKKEKKDRVSKAKKKSSRKIGNIRSIKDAFRAFRIRKLHMNIDTDDFMMNAWLIPAFSAVNNGRNVQMQVNFEGNMFLDLDLRTRIGSLAWIFIKNR